MEEDVMRREDVSMKGDVREVNVGCRELHNALGYEAGLMIHLLQEFAGRPQMDHCVRHKIERQVGGVSTSVPFRK
jgi:hypothetical protein